MTKQLHVANAAAGGLQAALLAQAGASGPSAIFENTWGGYFNTHGSAASKPRELVKDLGKKWHTAHSAIKMHAACRSAHPPIDGFIDKLSDGSISADAVQAVRIELSPFLRHMICPKSPSTVEAARMSLPISIALLLLGYRLDPDEYSRFHEPTVVEVLKKIEILESETLKTQQSVRLSVDTPGQTQTIERETARGSENDPFSSDEIREKFMRLTEPRIGRSKALHLADFVADLGKKTFEFPQVWSAH